MHYALRMTGEQHALLKAHLYPGDGLEAAALALCGRRAGSRRHIFAVREVVPIPHATCTERTPVRVTWPTQVADPLIREAMRRGFAILKIHSHPGGYEDFSEWDDRSDTSFFRSVSDLLEDGQPHASAVMLPDGRIFARAIATDGPFNSVALVTVLGDDLEFWYAGGDRAGTLPEFMQRHAQAFGSGTVERLCRLTVAVVGCSGTGSPLIEQLVRLGVGRLLLVDPDRVEWKNLNRINMTTAADANLQRPKVQVLAEAIGRIGLGTEVVTLASDLATPGAMRAVAEADLVFGCMDSAAGRDILNRLATYYVLPYIDMGIQLQALPAGGVDQITGAVHYLQPGRSSLKSRGVYDGEDVRAELLRQNDPAEYAKQLRQKYIRGVGEDRPAVISVNTMVAAMAVNELLARIHRYRYEPNDMFAAQRFALHEGHVFRNAESKLAPCPVLSKHVGRGDLTPLLDRPELSGSGRE